MRKILGNIQGITKFELAEKFSKAFSGGHIFPLHNDKGLSEEQCYQDLGLIKEDLKFLCGLLESIQVLSDLGIPVIVEKSDITCDVHVSAWNVIRVRVPNFPEGNLGKRTLESFTVGSSTMNREETIKNQMKTWDESIPSYLLKRMKYVLEMEHKCMKNHISEMQKEIYFA
jgi:hypothetical protein